MYTSIVVGTDGSQRARQAVEEAVRLAEITGAQLHIVTAYRPPSQAFGSALAAEALMVSSVSDGEVKSSVQETLENLADEIRARPVKVTTHLFTGTPGDALLDVAEQENADLIVVGNRGMTGAARFLGSVPNNIAHHAKCHVMIVQTS
jgi:nucleotide-binding universal stress UspA family protein